MREIAVEKFFVSEMKKAFPAAQILKYEARRSEPDRICLFPTGKAYFVELKRPGGGLRQSQVRAMVRLRDSGFDACVLTTKEEVANFIKHLQGIESPLT